MNQPNAGIVLLGDASSPEMQPVVAGLEGMGIAVAVRRVSDVDDVRRFAVDDGWFPDLIVALQSWPGQFPASAVRELLSLAPLARIVCVYGGWCDSEGRTHLNWPLAVRVPVSGGLVRIVREIATIRGETVALPLTAGRGEIFAADCAFTHTASTRSRRVAVESGDRHWRQMASAALIGGGHRVVSHANDRPVAIVWDADPCAKERLLALDSLRRVFPRATIVACVGFPHDDLAEELRTAGANAVWFKLAPLVTLLALLESCAEGPH